MKTVHQFGSFAKVEDNDDGTITVSGIASTANADAEGETVLPSAMTDALPDYMLFGAVREMHQATTAAGTALKCAVDDDGVTHFQALIVDDAAIKKVKSGVYKGFSIGGKVLKRDPLDKTVITGIKLTEISLVDRPCNPEAVINMWKVDSMSDKNATTAAGTKPANEEGAVDALAEMMNKGEVSPNELVQAAELVKAAKKAGKKMPWEKDDDATKVDPTTADEKGEPDDAKKAADAEDLMKKAYSKDERDKMAASGEAMKDGSFPIANKKDLANAVQAHGRASDPDAAKKHIKARAKALGAEDSLPDDWKKSAGADPIGKAAGTMTPATGEQDIPQANTPMLPAPKVGDVVSLKMGANVNTGRITEITGSMVHVGDDCMVYVSTDKLTASEVDGDTVKWSRADESDNTSKSAKSDTLRKGMWTVSDFAQLLQTIFYMQSGIQYEADQEKDGSSMPAQIAAWGKQGAQLLIAYVQEEAAELFSGIADPDNTGDVEQAIISLASKSGNLQKMYAESMDVLAKAGARNSKADMAHLQGAHDSLCKLGANCSKDNVAKDDGDDDMSMSAKGGDLKKALESGSLSKVLKAARDETMGEVEQLVKMATDGIRLKSATQLSKVLDENADLKKRLEVLEKQPAASAAVLHAVSKADDANGIVGEPAAKVEPVKANGQEDPVASAIKKAHASQGIGINHQTASRGF